MYRSTLPLVLLVGCTGISDATLDPTRSPPGIIDAEAIHALSAWRDKPSWDGWSELESTNAKAGLDRRASPAFRRVLGVHNLHGDSLERCIELLGAPDALTKRQAWLMRTLLEQRHGWPRVASWRGSIVYFGQYGLEFPVIRAKVLASRPERRQIMLSVGEKDGVEVGYRFLISRGDEYVSRVAVNAVWPDISKATVGPALSRVDIKKNDDAATSTF